MRNVFAPPPIPSFELRISNINHIFIVTIHSKNLVVETYDYCFSRLCFYNKGKHSYEFLHDRALKETLRLLK
jgi:hypothetical protein